MSQAFSINIEEVVDFLGLERKPRERRGASSFNVKCPFCNDSGYHLNINTAKNTYHCVKCMDGTWKNTGVLDLYGRVHLGTPATASNTKELFKSLLKDLGRDNSDYVPHKYTKQKAMAEEYHEIEPADDERLNEVYSVLLNLPYLELTPKHKANLLSRGLTEDDIRRNGYASMMTSAELLPFISGIWYKGCVEGEIERIKEYCARHNIHQYKNEVLHLEMYSDDDIVLGLKIAADVQRLTHKAPKNIPGFYKIYDKWAFRSVDSGILIPTRNIKGQIVGMQTRRDVKLGNGLRYMTVSSKGLDGGVTTSIARTHFPLGSVITGESTVILTEGPLKSDAALSLAKRLGCFQQPVFIALQGVNSTRELPEIAKMLESKGVKVVRDGFDIDKLVNPSVYKALKNARRILKEEGHIDLTPLFWDRKYAQAKKQQMKELCSHSGIKWDETGNLYRDLVTLSEKLTIHQLDYNFIITDGKKVPEKWNDRTKGIDDYLLSVLETAKPSGERN